MLSTVTAGSLMSCQANSTAPYRAVVLLNRHHFFFGIFSSSDLPSSHYTRAPSQWQLRSGVTWRALLPPPSPPRPHVPSLLSREKKSASSSLADSRRTVPTHAARRSQQLILFLFFLQINYNRSGNRTQKLTLLLAIVFEGNH